MQINRKNLRPVHVHAPVRFPGFSLFTAARVYYILLTAVICDKASFLAGVAAKYCFKQTVNYHINTKERCLEVFNLLKYYQSCKHGLLLLECGSGLIHDRTHGMTGTRTDNTTASQLWSGNMSVFHRLTNSTSYHS